MVLRVQATHHGLGPTCMASFPAVLRLTLEFRAIGEGVLAPDASHELESQNTCLPPVARTPVSDTQAFTLGRMMSGAQEAFRAVMSG